jgi:hypothetical protein
MVRYFYGWTSVIGVVGAVILLSNVFLALIALMLVSLVALAAFAWAILEASYMLGRAISHRWQGRSGASPQTAAALSPVTSGVRPIGSVPSSAAVLLANPPSERDT